MRARIISWMLGSCWLLVIGFQSGCVTTPETGRSQLKLVSDDQMLALGLQSFDQTKKQIPVSKDAAGTAMVQRVGKRIASVANLPGAQWEFVLFESKEANAFCLPGGKVGVYTGILPIVKDDAGLAAVLGHEVAHAALYHGRERISRSMGLELLGEGISTGIGAYGAKPTTIAGFQQVYGIGTQVGAELPHSRLQESEADQIGLRFMARAGYDPEASLAFWQRFAAFNSQNGGSGTPSFLRTHPTDSTRIEQIRRWLPEAKAQFVPHK